MLGRGDKSSEISPHKPSCTLKHVYTRKQEPASDTHTVSLIRFHTHSTFSLCSIKCLKLTSMYATMSTKTHPWMYSVTPLIPATLYVNTINQTSIYAFIYIHTEQVCIDNTSTTNEESHSFADERKKQINQFVLSLSLSLLYLISIHK